ncbi:hypothetical protein [Polystyrenella longa]|uniref:hypothetical protein n=1 Tax=Polystyrenella longa TaxID=2528007 RepID=UPI0018D25DD8|nr:hypothetical protein [Polystyrenella longa]
MGVAFQLQETKKAGKFGESIVGGPGVSALNSESAPIIMANIGLERHQWISGSMAMTIR